MSLMKFSRWQRLMKVCLRRHCDDHGRLVQHGRPKLATCLCAVLLMLAAGLGLSGQSLADEPAVTGPVINVPSIAAPLAIEPAVTSPVIAAPIATDPLAVHSEEPDGVVSAEAAQEPVEALQQPIEAAPQPIEAAQEQPAGEPMLRFSFSGASWREVLNWLAEESQLALHVGDVPSGSFTYFDPDTFSTDEAIARINLFLIPQGYTVVRRGKLLSVIGIGDPRSLQQLDALATLTSVDDLDKRSEHEVVKCIIPLGDVVAEEATAEMRPLMLMIAPVVLPKSNQLIVTETAGKIKSVLAVLSAMDQPKAEAVVRRFNLDHVDVETVITVAGSHLGLAAGESEGFDISISTDIAGKSLFVTGSPEKIARLETLLKVLDVPGESDNSLADMKLRSHRVTGDNLQAVYDVLQTILAGKSLRLSMQPSTGSIVALAEASVHAEIESTIQELQAPAMDFAVINLHSLDPYFVVTLIGEMFEPPTQANSSRRSSQRRDDDVAESNAPKVDADPGNRRLFVRGTSDQIKQIEQMVENLDTRQAGGDSIRVLPLQGQQRRQVLETAERFWNGDNRVLILPAADGNENPSEAIERAIHPEQAQDHPVSAPANRKVVPDNSYEAGATPPRSLSATREALISLSTDDPDQPAESRLAKAGRHSPSPIRSQLIPQGIMIQSEDLAALDRFQDHLLEIAASSQRAPSPPVVYYLKYVSAEDAVKMLADLLDGGKSLADTPPGSLVKAGSYNFRGFGSFTTNRDGMTTVTAGTATIVSDARLNRLIIQGTTEDVAVIDGYLKIVDKGSSITNIETFGRTHVIELFHTKAADVAEVVKQAYVGRIASGPQSGAQQGNRSAERPSGGTGSSGDASRRRDGEDTPREVAEKPTRGREPEMSVAVHESSNSLVITAPDALFAEVEQLVQSVDARSEQVTQVIPAAAGVDLETILRTLNGDAETSDRSNSRRSSGRDTRRGRSR